MWMKRPVSRACSVNANKHTNAIRPGIQGIPLLVISLSFASTLAVAQDFMPVRTLGQIGITENNQRVGDAVQAVCGQFVAENPDPAAANFAEQSALFDACGEMVHTANRIANSGGPEGRDLGIGVVELNAALQNAAGEESAAVSSLATETASSQTTVVNNRMATLISSSSTLKISSASILGQSAIVVADKDSQYPLSSGGAASADGGLRSAFGVYANVAGAFTNRSSTNDEDGFTADGSGFVVGADYFITDSFLLGAAFGFSASTLDFRVSDFVAGGSMDSEQTSVTGYGMWFSGNKYVNAVVGVGQGSADLERRILIQATDEAIALGNDGLNDTVDASTDTVETRLSLGAGMESNTGWLTLAAFGRISYLDLTVDGYDEAGSALALRVDEQDVESVTSSLGFRLVGAYSNQAAVILPQFSFEWVREYSDDERQIVSAYVNDPRQNSLVVVTDEPDRNYFIAGIGASAVFRNGIQAFVDVKSLLDLDSTHQTAVTLGGRYEF